MADPAERPRYVGRTVRPLPARVRSHRSARRARWLKDCNEELARWLETHVPVAVPLEEVAEPGTEWQTEKRWIHELASDELLNIRGNPLRQRPKRCGGRKTPAAAAA